MFRQNLGLIRKLSLSQFRTSNLLITDSAASRLKEICSPTEYLRVSVGGGGCSGDGGGGLDDYHLRFHMVISF